MKGNWSLALQGLGAGLQGQGPEWAQQQYANQEREKLIQMEEQRRQAALQAERAKSAALSFRSIGQLIDDGQIARAETVLGQTYLGSQGTPMAQASMQLYQMIKNGQTAQARQLIGSMDKEFTTRLGLPEPEQFTLGPDDTRWDVTGNFIARGEPKVDMREDQNGILRFTSGPDSGQPVFPDVVASIEQIPNKDYAAMAGDFRDEIYRANSDFYKLASSWDRISAGVDGPSPVGDLALIYNFMKMLDPGSTVMQGEIASAENTTGVAGQIYGLYNRLVSGDKLLPEQRADFYKQAQEIYNKSKERASQIENQFAAMAERRGISRQDVLVDRGPDPDVSGAMGGAGNSWSNLPTITTFDEYNRLPSGTEYVEVINGVRYRAQKP